MNYYLICFVMISSIFFSCSEKKSSESYKVKRLLKPFEIDAVWEKAPWTDVKPLIVNRYMGEKPEHFPGVQAKLVYDDDAIYVIWRVEDRYIRSVAQKYQDAVYKDSCVEFFLTPNNNTSQGYFNLEINCGGTALFNFQKQPRKDVIQIPESYFLQVQIAHTLPEISDPEISEAKVWTVEYRIPFSVLKNFSVFNKPVQGSTWRANFYKCADNSSHPHWLTWALVDYPKPNFHLPAFFGELYFE